MNKILFAIGVSTCVCLGFIHTSEFPIATISNGLVKAELHLPDPERGYYRGTRFDWSGVMPSLEYKGHRYFDVWNPQPYTPTLHDAITGPVEEFTPLGFDEAAVGGEFLKIGVGTLVKPDSKPYSFARNYEIKDGGSWEVKKEKDRVVFTHRIRGASGYSYDYQKKVLLIEGKPQLVLEHSLTNTGTKPIKASTYNHNFFVIDGEPTGPTILTTFPFEASAVGKGFGTIADARNKSIVYRRPLEKGENVYTSGVEGFGTTSQDYDITIRNLRSGAGVRIRGDQPLEKMVYWSCPTTSCPEPYIRLSVPLGETFRWNISYEFNTDSDN